MAAHRSFDLRGEPDRARALEHADARVRHVLAGDRSAPRRRYGPGPHGGREILYVGSSDGSLYALNATTGRRRWSFNAVSSDPILRDRHALNSSPALRRTGVYIASPSCWTARDSPSPRLHRSEHLDGPRGQHRARGAEASRRHPHALAGSRLRDRRRVRAVHTPAAVEATPHAWEAQWRGASNLRNCAWKGRGQASVSARVRDHTHLFSSSPRPPSTSVPCPSRA